MSDNIEFQKNALKYEILQQTHFGNLLVLKHFPWSDEDEPIEPDNNTFLIHHFTCLGSVKQVESVVAKGAKMDVIEADTCMTPLMIACRYGEFKMVKVLLDAGANPLIKGKDGRNAFNFAFQFSSEETFRLVLDRVLAKNEGMSPSHMLTYINTLSPYNVPFLTKLETRNDLILFSRWFRYNLGLSTDMRSFSLIIEYLILSNKDGLVATLMCANENEDLPLLELLLRHMYRHRKDENTLYVVKDAFIDALNRVSPMKILSAYSLHLYKLGELLVSNFW